jgi:hypothetical protein|tara:strand:+ start:10328 stop:10669 length:342 start_codon:yes stop_codon:yes gene_type:complete
MAFQEKQLGQHRENSTNAVSVYSPANSVTGIIRNITLCNTSTSSATFRIFLDNDGTTYNETTAKYYDTALAAKTTLQLGVFWAMNNPAGNLAFQNGTANAITITADGAEIDIS